MNKIFLALVACAALCFSTPSFADCGVGQVSYLRSSQREFRGLDFRLRVNVQTPSPIALEAPVIDVTTSYVNPTASLIYSGGNTVYSFQLHRDSETRWSYEDRSDSTYTRVSLSDNRDGTATIRVAMRVPYTVFDGGLGYFASIRSCE